MVIALFGILIALVIVGAGFHWIWRAILNIFLRPWQALGYFLCGSAAISFIALLFVSLYLDDKNEIDRKLNIANQRFDAKVDKLLGSR